MKLESSIIKNVLVEELERQKRLEQSYIKKIEELPKGAIFERIVGKKKYYYLNYREGNRVISKYIKASEIEEIKEQVERRKEIEDLLKNIRINIRSLEKVVS